MSVRLPDTGGLLVLGMHRSGTSALARVLGLCGADLGSRVASAGAGNETGHWEDSFAVELHDRLLSQFGATWDSPFALPRDWLGSAQGVEAVAGIADYLRGNRALHPLWASKDPRLCLFAPAWTRAAGEAGMPLAAVMVLRDPAEVAGSLAARDGIARGRGLLLWLEYAIAAADAAQAVPVAVLDYQELLEDWRAALGRIAALPGLSHLDRRDAAVDAAVSAFLDPTRRHQRRQATEALPVLVDRAWRLLRGAAADGRFDPAIGRELRDMFAPLQELLHPVMVEARHEQRQVWLRAARAEAALATDAMSIPAALAAMERGVESNRERIVDAISVELRRMQEIVNEANASAIVARAAADRIVEDARAETARAQSDAATARAEAAAAQSDAASAQSDAANARAEALAAQSDAANARAEALEAQSDAANARAEALEAQSDAAGARAEVLEAQSDAAGARAEVAARQRDLELLRYEKGQLQEIAREFDRVVHSRSWRLTRPLRGVARLLRGELRASLKPLHSPQATPAMPAIPAMQEVAVTVDAAPPAPPAAAFPAPVRLSAPVAEQGELPDVFIWSVIDWYFRFQRPQHLAEALAAKGHRVFYVSNNFDNDATPGFRCEQIDGAGRLFQVNLNLAGSPSIYAAMPSADQVASLRRSLAEVLQWAGTSSAISLVQHPFWKALARSVPDARVVYDCMDHHGGFADNKVDVLAAEEALVRDADLVVVSSGWLRDEIEGRARALAVVRNACEFEFFSKAPASVFRDPQGRRVIGYYGAIAEWFDADLVRAVAQANPGALVVLVGRDTAGVAASLADLDNVQFVGEVPYGELPYWLYGFDACMLPFKVMPLTLATNPVKVYEYLASGKPVVSIDLPEMIQFGGVVRVAADVDGFVAGVAAALGEEDVALADARRAFAATQTWAHRAGEFDA
ncbi:glycosyltransferase, partial [Luteimonas sp. 8-5]|uniref:glycosyltransferase n=1 Tax=Luteimonas sp. 8-5 TaxID=3039387 RepID=UPI0024364A59